MSSSKAYTLVTGASNGIGKAFAEEAAARGYNVLLVALPEPALDEATHSLQSQYPDQHFDSMGVNLMEKEAPQSIKEWCQAQGYSVNILINNAGLGNSGPFESMPAEFYYGQMQLNMVSLVSLTHHFLPELKKHDKGYVLNVASMAAFYDIPFKGIYSASKKFVLSFTQSLNKELEQTNISISALCPAAVPTNDAVKQRTQELGYFARLSVKMPEEVAKYSFDQMFSGKTVIIPGWFSRFLKNLGKLIPNGIQLNMLANQFIKNKK